ncbi:cytochrome c oxidase subunit II [Oxalobacteraceae bacterium CAVE-383]|nr:cytochrome c oxidase subunit II [Oxalobacteraceae bacterium CAVE-383]
MQDMLRPRGIQAEHILHLWNFTLLLCTVVFVAVLLAFLYALWRAPRADAHAVPDAAPAANSERRVHRVIVWAAALSAAGLMTLLAADVLTGRALAQLPTDDAIHIELVGHDWWWEANYEDQDPARRFTTANELHLPVGRAAIITLHSADVIHTLWIPNLHGKKDLIPGRTAEIRLRADQAGVYSGQCAEFCGMEHARMALSVIAEAPDRYEAWAAAQRRPASAASAGTGQIEHGMQVFTDHCAGCHTVRDTAAKGRLGPDLTHLASRQTIAAGILPNRRGQLAAWVADAPSFKPGTSMPPSTLSPDDLQALLGYLEALK